MVTDLAARRFFLVLLTTSIVLLGLVVWPFASALFIAAVLAGVLWPLHERLAKKLKGRRALSAGLFIALAILLVLVPLALMSGFLVSEATAGVEFITKTMKGDGLSGLVETLPAPLRGWTHAFVERVLRDPEALNEAIEKKVSEQGGQAAAVVGGLVAATGSALLQTAMMLIALYFLLVEGAQFVNWLDENSPLPRGQTLELLTDFKKVSSAVVISTVITAAVQAAAAFIGYLFARVPHPIFFATVTFFFAMIPAIGAGAVCLCAAALLLATGHPYAAGFLAVWGVTVVGLADNVVKPLLIKGDVEMHGAVVFFALLGGLAIFGPVGLVLGPLVVALFLALLRIYARDYRSPTRTRKSGAPEDAQIG
jgi:predicted PurR-regulated permease PerM